MMRCLGGKQAVHDFLALECVECLERLRKMKTELSFSGLHQRSFGEMLGKKMNGKSGMEGIVIQTGRFFKYR